MSQEDAEDGDENKAHVEAALRAAKDRARSRLTAAIPMENPYRSCKLTRSTASSASTELATLLRRVGEAEASAGAVAALHLAAEETAGAFG